MSIALKSPFLHFFGTSQNTDQISPETTRETDLPALSNYEQITVFKTHNASIERFTEKQTNDLSSNLDWLDLYLDSLEDLNPDKLYPSSDTAEFDLLQYMDSSSGAENTSSDSAVSKHSKNFLKTLKVCIKNSSNKRRKKTDPYPLTPKRKYSLDFRIRVLHEVCCIKDLKEIAQKYRLSVNKVEDFIKYAIRLPAKHIPKVEKQGYKPDSKTTSNTIDNAAPEIDDSLSNYQARKKLLTFLENYSGNIEHVLHWFLRSSSINAVFRQHVLGPSFQAQRTLEPTCTKRHALNSFQNKNIPMQQRIELFEQYITFYI